MRSNRKSAPSSEKKPSVSERASAAEPTNEKAKVEKQKFKSRILKKRLRTRYAVIGLISVCMVCVVMISIYISSLLDKPTHTDIPIVTGGEVSEGILDSLPDPDELDASSLDSSDSASASGEQTINPVYWGNGRVKLYVDSRFPITYVAQKDPNVENILLIGVDARSSSEMQSRTDSILIVTIDRNTDAVKLTSIMRDTQVKIPGRTQPTKINAAYVYGGVGLLINTINLNFDLDIQKVAMVDMYSAENVINAAGGVVINVTKSELYHLNVGVNEANGLFSKISTPSPNLYSSGEQRLDGRQAVSYGRIRYIGSDTARTQRQRTVLSALIVSFKASSLSRKMSVFESCLKAIETNITRSDLLFMAFDVLSGMKNIQQYRIPQEGLYTTNMSNYQLVVNYTEQIPALHKFIWGGSSGAVITMPADPSESESADSSGTSGEISSDSSDSSGASDSSSSSTDESSASSSASSSAGSSSTVSTASSGAGSSASGGPSPAH